MYEYQFVTVGHGYISDVLDFASAGYRIAHIIPAHSVNSFPVIVMEREFIP